MNRSRSLITGITGMVGSHLADFLLENTDWDIFGMCRWRAPNNETIMISKGTGNAGNYFFHQRKDQRDCFSSDKIAKMDRASFRRGYDVMYLFHFPQPLLGVERFWAPDDFGSRKSGWGWFP